VDVTATGKTAETPAWLIPRADDAKLGGTDYPVAPLAPPEVPSHARPALAPLLESVRPPAGSRPPSQFPAAAARTALGSLGLSSVPPPPRPPSVFPSASSPSQAPGAGSPSLHPGSSEASALDVAPVAGRLVRRDTLIEDLVPRAEEEAVQAIKAAIADFALERAQALQDAEKELVELVKVICRRVVLREVTLSSSVIEALVQEGLSALGRNDQVTVKLGPFFADALEHISDNLHHRGVQCSVIIDPAVGAHGCVLETALGRVDESVEARLNVLLASLDTVP
jgi:hypothetical protein